MMDGHTKQQGHELLLTRHFAAPPALLFNVWTQPEHMCRWWGCAQATICNITSDQKAGGRFRAVMKLEDGSTHIVRGRFLEIDPPARLVFTWTWENTEGPMAEETLVTVTFEASGDGTDLTLSHDRFVNEELRDLHGEGWTASLDRLVDYLPAAG